ncbi:MAG: NTP transferase domain-containing protein [Bryobacteraceae bacterium]|nr:NTP transferase domain-containing protein [Bryobacteraceae bacterium]
MSQPEASARGVPLVMAARLARDKILNGKVASFAAPGPETPVLVVLAAGKGTRFGNEPKCVQPVDGTPLARHSIDAFRRAFNAPHVVCVVGYRYAEVSATLGADNIYVRSDNPAGGTAFAAYEAFCVPALDEGNPLLIVTMGDRIVPSSVFHRLWETHRAGGREADLTFLTAKYEPPAHRGKGRVVRSAGGHVLRVMEERDILAEPDAAARQRLLDLTEGNCPVYVVRADALRRYLNDLTNLNAQGQYYLTDIIEGMSRNGCEIRTTVTSMADPEYDLLCSDVTRPVDLALLEGILKARTGELFPEEAEIDEAARLIAAGRPRAQIASIACQLSEIRTAIEAENLGFKPYRALGVGISGGRLRVAFMHPDMGRFFGPAWQMPIGAGDENGREQIVMVVQEADDRRIHLHPLNPRYRESINFVSADDEVMYPGDHVSDLHAYEGFGTRMSETLLLSLGYFSDEELERRRQSGQPLPPPSLWVSSNMRRPFALIGNAIASMRTLRTGAVGAAVQKRLGRQEFRGLRMVSTGSIPQGGFSSSSAVTVATKNAVNALFEIGIPPDVLVHLACQAEYGTGVRAGSLDQATEQKGRAGEGALISSNPRDNYRILGTFPVPAERFQIVFPYTVERDRSAWRWSAGVYGESAASGALTTAEFRKMTGKAAEIAAILTHLPLDTDFFKVLESDLVSDGILTRESRAWICSVLRQLPLLAPQEELRLRAHENISWYRDELLKIDRLEEDGAARKAEAAVASLFAGWREPVLRRRLANGTVVREKGVPLRAIVAYLFGEVAKNFYLIHHQDRWIEYVALSQLGDRCFDIDPDRLPSREAMLRPLDWERDAAGADLLDRWLERYEAAPFDFNRGLDDETLSAAEPPEFHRLAGSNFFRGLALIDLAEAMLRRAFGPEAVAVRVNAAGQGDYFQVHVDTSLVSCSAVQDFLRAAFCRRFDLAPENDFVQLHPGGGAVGVRLSRYDSLPRLISRLKTATRGASA